jgi:hypothetical protein
MFNIRIKNLFIVLFLLISVTFIYGCSSKPSESAMKKAIKSIASSNVEDVTYEKFEIKKEVTRKVNNKDCYCVSVDIKGKLSTDKGKTTQEFNKQDARFCFTRSGFKWKATQGWSD